jgi:hypothetical protein
MGGDTFPDDALVKLLCIVPNLSSLNRFRDRLLRSGDDVSLPYGGDKNLW